MSKADTPKYRSIKETRDGFFPGALIMKPDASIVVHGVEVSWSEQAAAHLHQISEAGKKTGKDMGRSLPYSYLRAALHLEFPEAIIVDTDLQKPWATYGGTTWPFLYLADTGRDWAAAFARAFRLWIQGELTAWGKALDLDDSLIDDLYATAGNAIVVKKMDQRDAGPELAAGEMTPRLKRRLLQFVVSRLRGKELFREAGPVQNVVASFSGTDRIELQAWPHKAGNRLVSMYVTIWLFSDPFQKLPILSVKAHRRRWLPTVPTGQSLRERNSVSVYIMHRGEQSSAHVKARIIKGKIEQPQSSHYMLHLLKMDGDKSASLEELVQRGPVDGTFVGIPHNNAHDRSFPVGSGASIVDNVDVFTEIGRHLEDAFTPLGCESSRPIRIKRLKTEKVDENAFAECLARKLAEDRTGPGAGVAREAEKLLQGYLEGLGAKAAAVPEAHESKLDMSRRVAAAQARKPTVVVMARTEPERYLLRQCLSILFGDLINIAEESLPPGAHGPDTGKSPNHTARFNDCVDIWEKVAEDIARRFPTDCLVLVQADSWYEQQRLRDDVVNKPAARHTLAAVANANVQYLLPPFSMDGNRWDKEKDFGTYVHRVRAAVNDLLLGHSGSIHDVGQAVASAFDGNDNQPGSIIGISVLALNRGPGLRAVKAFVAERIDVSSGRMEAKVGWDNGGLRTTGWMPFNEVLKTVARTDFRQFSGQKTLSVHFQAFVDDIIEAACTNSECPLVLFDSDNASRLWNWLKDENIGKAPEIDSWGVTKQPTWKGARLVRVRREQAPHVFARKTLHLETVPNEEGTSPTLLEIPNYTITAAAVRVSADEKSGGAFYCITHTLDGKGFHKLNRSQSVYRDTTVFSKPINGYVVEKTLKPYKKGYPLSRAIDVVVARLQPGDDPDRIAQLVANLRRNFGHTDIDVTMPAPLFFEKKVEDYICQYDSKLFGRFAACLPHP